MHAVVSSYSYGYRDITDVIQKIILRNKLYIVYKYQEDLYVDVSNSETLQLLGRYLIHDPRNKTFLLHLLITKNKCYLLENDGLYMFDSFDDFVRRGVDEAKARDVHYIINSENIALNNPEIKYGYWYLINGCKYLLKVPGSVHGDIYACCEYKGIITIFNLSEERSYTYDTKDKGNIYAYVKYKNIVILMNDTVLIFDTATRTIREVVNTNFIQHSKSFYDYISNGYILDFFAVEIVRDASEEYPEDVGMYVYNNKVLFTANYTKINVRNADDVISFIPNNEIDFGHKIDVPREIVMRRSLMFDDTSYYGLDEIKFDDFACLPHYVDFIKTGYVNTDYLSRIFMFGKGLYDVDTEYIAICMVNFCVYGNIVGLHGENVDISLASNYLVLLRDYHSIQYYVLLKHLISTDTIYDVLNNIDSNVIVEEINRYLNSTFEEENIDASVF